jgi:hypothetical protein
VSLLFYPPLTPRLVLDCIDHFFTLVNTRIPVLDPETFEARFATPDTHPEGPVSHALLAVVLAWGSRFLEEPAIFEDREECSVAYLGLDRSRTRMGELLVVRAREVVEANKVFRVPTMENVQTLCLMETLMARESSSCT